MPRVIITSDRPDQDGGRVLLDERVDSERLSDDRAAGQFLERLGWAINDAEESAAATASSRSARRFGALSPGAGNEPALAGPQPSRVALLLAREAA